MECDLCDGAGKIKVKGRAYDNYTSCWKCRALELVAVNQLTVAMWYGMNNKQKLLK